MRKTHIRMNQVTTWILDPYICRSLTNIHCSTSSFSNCFHISKILYLFIFSKISHFININNESKSFYETIFIWNTINQTNSCKRILFKSCKTIVSFYFHEKVFFVKKYIIVWAFISMKKFILVKKNTYQQNILQVLWSKNINIFYGSFFG